MEVTRVLQSMTDDTGSNLKWKRCAGLGKRSDWEEDRWDDGDGVMVNCNLSGDLFRSPVMEKL